MGQRANLLLRREGRTELFYTHWRANTLDSDLFWGPAAAEAFIRAQRSESEGAAWLDEVWAEGGAVVDFDRRVLLWFGGEEGECDVPLRRVHLALMRELWPEWSVRWAHGHLPELATYVGRSTEDLLTPEGEAWTPSLEAPEAPDWLSSVVSFEGPREEWKLLGLDQDASELALVGVRLVALLDEADLPDRLDASRGPEFPQGGLHVDAVRRRLDVWTAPPQPVFEERLQAKWPGWGIRWHRDRFEAVSEKLGNRLQLPERDPVALVDRVRSAVLRAPPDRGGLVQELTGVLGAESVVGVNPFALRDDPPAAPDHAHAEAFERAVASASRRGGRLA